MVRMNIIDKERTHLISPWTRIVRHRLLHFIQIQTIAEQFHCTPYASSWREVTIRDSVNRLEHVIIKYQPFVSRSQ